MLVYRLVSAQFANDLSGEGARLFGGRWNHKGVPCVYTSFSRALAILEFSVNVDAHNMPDNLCLVTINIPEDSIKKFTQKELPENWNIHPASSEIKEFGSEILRSKKYSVVEFPSTVIPEENNYLLNPLHKAAAKFEIVEIIKYPYDSRIKK